MIYIILAVVFFIFAVNLDDKLLKYMSYGISAICLLFTFFNF